MQALRITKIKLKISYSALSNCMTVPEYLLSAIILSFHDLRGNQPLHDSFDDAGKSSFEESFIEEIKEDDNEESPLRRAITEEGIIAKSPELG